MRLTREQFNELARRKPHLLGVGAIPPAVGKPDTQPALDRHPQRKRQSKGRTLIRCSIIQCRHRLLDDDNAVSGGTKALRDAIAKMFGLDDADRRIKFEYGQLHTTGAEGCLIKLELVCATM